LSARSHAIEPLNLTLAHNRYADIVGSVIRQKMDHFL
jgi:hypothetical protein